MNTLYLIRHSLTEANALRLYGGSTDSPLTAEGQEIALKRRGAVPPCDVYVSSGMRRADETLRLMTGRDADFALPGLREMDFGAFEMRSYEQLKDDPAYMNWIGDRTGTVRCPGGENLSTFKARVLNDGARLIALTEKTACAVCHGGVIVNLMQAWFPGEARNFYQWQPGPCGGYKIDVADGRPARFQEV
ncbi:MAG: histidine phosphatase family protein [Clostridia bacterium]|nr:histidine phosphatase family protein [Clostridia bacterium]